MSLLLIGCTNCPNYLYRNCYKGTNFRNCPTFKLAPEKVLPPQYPTNDPDLLKPSTEAKPRPR